MYLKNGQPPSSPLPLLPRLIFVTFATFHVVFSGRLYFLVTDSKRFLRFGQSRKVCVVYTRGIETLVSYVGNFGLVEWEN